MDSEHIVKSFDSDLLQIESLIAEMGGLVETQISDATTVLTRRDTVLGKEVIALDKRVDEIEFEVDAAVVRILALRQPRAQDLRAVLVVLKLAGNLERIGDYAKNICKRTSVLANSKAIGNSSATIKRMGNLVQEMIKDVLDAYVSRDIDTADDVRLRDQEVDQMHNALFRELLTHMMEDPRNITPCMHLLFIAKNVERMGDHVTSMAEQVHFLVCGKMPDDERPKGDNTSYSSVELNTVNGESNDG